jgi:L-2-hydroxyglutarate oxidase LhgO
LCAAGRERLYDFCKRAGVEHRRCGKLIVATDESQVSELEKIRRRAASNGVALDWLDGTAARAMEPALSCVAALHSPLTGIIDSQSYMVALLGQAEAHGAQIVYRTRVSRAWCEAGGIALAVNDESSATLRTRMLINCAGLHASAVARSIERFPARHVPRAYLAKGNYFTVDARSPFSRLIYPVPEPGGLGVHITFDLGGRARFGPDVQWIDSLDYSVDPHRAQSFYAAIRCYWPALPDDALRADYAGIRPKISGPHEPAADFLIEGPREHGVPGVVNLFGIESPGLTASLAIAEHVVGRVDAL